MLYKEYIFGFQNEIKMWGRIKESFHECAALPACRLNTLFNIMLNSAMPKKVTVFDSNQQSSIPQDVRFLSAKNFQGNLDMHQTVNAVEFFFIEFILYS